jgi:hypothetical protein
MERKRITCPETARLEEIDLEHTPLGTVIAGCSRFSPRCAVECGRECTARMDRHDRRDRDDHTERVLVACTGTDAQTAAISRALADELGRDQLIVEVADLDRGIPPAPADYEAVVIAAPVRFGRLARSARTYVEAHRRALSAMPGFLISVRRSRASRSLDRVLAGARWQPTMGVTLERPGWLARQLGDPDTLVDSARIHELALAIADELTTAT